MTYGIIIGLVTLNICLIKKLSTKETARREVVDAKKQLARNRKILMKQYLEMGTLERR